MAPVISKMPDSPSDNYLFFLTCGNLFYQVVLCFCFHGFLNSIFLRIK